MRMFKRLFALMHLITAANSLACPEVTARPTAVDTLEGIHSMGGLVLWRKAQN